MPAVTTSTDGTAVSVRSPLISWLAVISVMMGIFSIVTAEILPIGLLRPIGDTFGVSDGTAGLMMTLPGILATTYWAMMVSRVLVGFVIGAFWSIGAGLASRLVSEKQVGKATAVIFSAVPLGSVLGVPAGTFIGNLMGWRAAFVLMGVLTVGVFVALIMFVPPLPPESATRLTVLRDMLRTTNIQVGLVVTFLIVLAHFGTYTYVTPFLEDVTHASPGLITTFLLIYGGAGIVGNFLAGTRVTCRLRTTFTTAAVMLAAATLLLPVIGKGSLGAIVLLVVWGLAYGAVPVCSQTWFVTSAPHAPEVATVLFTSSFQATISLGALTGGVVVDSTSTSTVMTLGGTAAIMMVLTMWVFSRPGQLT